MAEKKPTLESRKLDVVVNIFALQWLASRIGGDLVSVHAIEAEPHEEGASTSTPDSLSEPDKELIRQADANLFAGNMSSDLRDILDRWRDSDPHARLYDISELEALDLQPGPAELGHDLIGDRLDPHFWMDPQRMEAAEFWVTTQLFSAVTLDEVLKRNPQKYKQELEGRRDTVVVELEALNDELASALPQDCHGRWIVPEHPAFMYLADRYELQQFAVSGLWSEELPRHVRREREAELAQLFEVGSEPAFGRT